MGVIDVSDYLVTGCPPICSYLRLVGGILCVILICVDLTNRLLPSEDSEFHNYSSIVKMFNFI